MRLRKQRGSTRALAALLPLLLSASSCVALRVETRRHLDVFDTVREAITADYPFLGRKAIDWGELAKQYRSAVDLSTRPSQFYNLLAGLLAELDDRHVSLEIPEDNWIAKDGAREDYRLDHRSGFQIAFIEGRIHVTAWPRGEAPVPPDHLAGDATRLPELLEVERYRAVPSLLDIYFRGPAGSRVALTLRWSDGTLSRHVLRRPDVRHDSMRSARAPKLEATRRRVRDARETRDSRVAASPPLRARAEDFDDEALVELSEQREFSVLRIRSFAPTSAMPRGRLQSELHAAIDEAIERRKPLVLDLRANGGGLLGLAMSVARRFLSEPYAIAFDEPDRSLLLGAFNVETLVSEVLEPRTPSFDRGLAVLIDSLTASAAELLARTLQDGANAVVIGERSAGIAASRKEVPLPDGSALRFGAGDILDRRGNTLQDRGVLPDVPVRQRADRFAQIGWARAQREWNLRCFRAARAVLSGRAGPR